MKKIILLPVLFLIHFCHSQTKFTGRLPDGKDLRIYPSNWWVGMKNPRLQVMIHSRNIGRSLPDFDLGYPGVTLESVERVGNPNYIFLNLNIAATARPGNVKIAIHLHDTFILIAFPLKEYPSGNGKTYARSINSSDFIYLLMPDRFSNGDPGNDRYANMRDTVADRKNPLARHGGDLQGVINHLDYIQQLGATAIWLTPVIPWILVH